MLPMLLCHLCHSLSDDVSNLHCEQTQQGSNEYCERILLYIAHRASPIRNHLLKSSYYALLRFSQKGVPCDAFPAHFELQPNSKEFVPAQYARAGASRSGTN
ncbi:hypothetical protein HBI80_160620 [Parastagonospora nodorum]|nr:hypothetical protein HBI80_160620 [Parastagonospora nodorum]KAH5436330.1 hypothetical protein HBI47_073570 [Parastagonospora nodorum]